LERRPPARQWSLANVNLPGRRPALRFMGSPHDFSIAPWDHEPSSRQCELADPSRVGRFRRFTTAATTDRFMGSLLFFADLLTGHEPSWTAAGSALPRRSATKAGAPRRFRQPRFVRKRCRRFALPPQSMTHANNRMVPTAHFYRSKRSERRHNGMSLFKQELCLTGPHPWETLIPSFPSLPSVNPISEFEPPNPEIS
jgi:hypothetical protein